MAIPDQTGQRLKQAASGSKLRPMDQCSVRIFKEQVVQAEIADFEVHLLLVGVSHKIQVVIQHTDGTGPALNVPADPVLLAQSTTFKKKCGYSPRQTCASSYLIYSDQEGTFS